MQEHGYSVVFHVPREDGDVSFANAPDHVTFCPYKDDAWYYEFVSPIKRHLAFYPNRVDAIEEVFG
jgi:uncharacterized protein (DUF427 family)